MDYSHTIAPGTDGRDLPEPGFALVQHSVTFQTSKDTVTYDTIGRGNHRRIDDDFLETYYDVNGSVMGHSETKGQRRLATGSGYRDPAEGLKKLRGAKAEDDVLINDDDNIRPSNLIKSAFPPRHSPSNASQCAPEQVD